MNLLAGLVIVVCLFVSEIDSQVAAEDAWIRVAAMLLVAFSVPGLAVFQTLVLTKKSRLSQLPVEQQEKTLQRLAVCHTGVWLVASLMIVWGIKWQTVVRSNWALDRWPLVDEALILLPIVLSLVASWAIFYDVQRALVRDLKRPPSSSLFAKIFDRKRMAFATVRFRLYFAISLLPLCVLIGLRDITSLTDSTPLGTLLWYSAATVLVVVGFPYLLGLVWNVQPVTNTQLANELKHFCKQYRLRVAGVRVWNTDQQIVNAMVVGFVPWFRTIIVTDGMLNRFTKQELFAILRHEAGHIKLCHLPIRVGFVLLPLLVLAAAEQMGFSVITKLNSAAVALGITGQPEWLAISFLYAVYLIATLSWLSKKMEYEADLFAIGVNPEEKRAYPGRLQANSEDENSGRISMKSKANELMDALLRFASHFPQQLERNTLMHPSLRQRMARIAKFRDNPNLVDDMKFAWDKQLILLLVVVEGVCLTGILFLK